MKKGIINQLEALNQETASIFKELEQISIENLQKNGKGWSIIQVLSHLNRAETLSLQYMQKKMQAGNKMGKVGARHRLRMWLSCGLLSSSLKWRAPSYISQPKGDYSLEEIHEKWMSTREKIKEYIDNYPDEFLDRLVYKHPMAGRLTLQQAVDSFIYHQRHHVHQIKRIRKELKF